MKNFLSRTAEFNEIRKLFVKLFDEILQVFIWAKDLQICGLGIPKKQNKMEFLKK